MKRFWIMILIAGTALVAMSAYHYLTRPSAGDLAPEFSLNSLGNSTASLSDYRGRPVLIHFWATWCGICLKEFPALMRFSKEMEGHGLVVLAVSEDGKGAESSLTGFFKDLLPPFPVLLDGTGEVADLYQSFGVPETFLIDQGGIIVWRKAGPIDWAGDEVKEQIRSCSLVRWFVSSLVRW